VVIGGGLVGCETALWLANEGKELTIVEMLPELMAGGLPVPHMNKQMLLDLLVLNKVKVITGVTAKKIVDGGVIVSDKAKDTLVKADSVVLAAGLKSDDELYRAIIGKVAHLYVLGDCQSPRNIMGAIWDGYDVGRAV
jgi:2-enoate reductase